MNSLTREGRTYVSSTDDPALTDFIHTFCGDGDDPGYDTLGKLLTNSVDPTLPNLHHLHAVDEQEEEESLSQFNGKQKQTKIQQCLKVWL